MAKEFAEGVVGRPEISSGSIVARELAEAKSASTVVDKAAYSAVLQTTYLDSRGCVCAYQASVSHATAAVEAAAAEAENLVRELARVTGREWYKNIDIARREAKVVTYTTIKKKQVAQLVRMIEPHPKKENK